MRFSLLALAALIATIATPAFPLPQPPLAYTSDDYGGNVPLAGKSQPALHQPLPSSSEWHFPRRTKSSPGPLHRNEEDAPNIRRPPTRRRIGGIVPTQMHPIYENHEENPYPGTITQKIGDNLYQVPVIKARPDPGPSGDRPPLGRQDPQGKSSTGGPELRKSKSLLRLPSLKRLRSGKTKPESYIFTHNDLRAPEFTPAGIAKQKQEETRKELQRKTSQALVDNRFKSQERLERIFAKRTLENRKFGLFEELRRLEAEYRARVEKIEDELRRLEEETPE